MDDYYYIKEKATPLLIKLTINHDLPKKYLEAAQLISEQLLGYYINELRNKTSSANCNCIHLEDLDFTAISDALNMLTSLHQLDIAKSYEYFINVLGDLSELTDQTALSMHSKTLVEMMNRFTIINEKDNRVDMDVEEMILFLYQKMENRKPTFMKGYFTVGLNQSLMIDAVKEDTRFGDSTNSMGWAGEKIGVKFPVINWKRMRSEQFDKKSIGSIKTEEPLISDLYLNVFGSGLLYNLANLNTEEGISGSQLGAGIGLAFFNNLDISLNYTTWLGGSRKVFDTGVVGLSFDLRFLDYLTALRKKRESHD